MYIIKTSKIDSDLSWLRVYGLNGEHIMSTLDTHENIVKEIEYWTKKEGGEK
jgi:hypothetical protein